jgi:hypothetical protein
VTFEPVYKTQIFVHFCGSQNSQMLCVLKHSTIKIAMKNNTYTSNLVPGSNLTKEFSNIRHRQTSGVTILCPATLRGACTMCVLLTACMITTFRELMFNKQAQKDDQFNCSKLTYEHNFSFLANTDARISVSRCYSSS